MHPKIDQLTFSIIINYYNLSNLMKSLILVLALVFLCGQSEAVKVNSLLKNSLSSLVNVAQSDNGTACDSSSLGEFKRAFSYLIDEIRGGNVTGNVSGTVSDH